MRFGSSYDMHGNVLEWCSNWYANYSDYSLDPLGTVLGSSRAARGSSWQTVAKDCRTSSRYSNAPDARSFNLVFRIVLAPIQ